MMCSMYMPILQTHKGENNMITEGIELTRGTKKIIQEAIETVDIAHRNDRIRLCEEFCRIVETRYTGGAMNYQLKRMGNSYPLELLSRNVWTIQDALEEDLVIYLTSDWFLDKQIKKHNGHYYLENRAIIRANDNELTTLQKEIEQMNQLPILSNEQLNDFNVSVVTDLTESDLSQTEEISVWERVSDDVAYSLDEKVFWLTPLVAGQDENGVSNDTLLNKVLNFTEAQARAKGIQIGKGNSVKVPLKTTTPILEAIDKFLYDKTGQYVS